MQNDSADIRHEPIGAAMTGKTRLQLPTGAKQRMAIAVFNVQKKMNMTANDKVGGN